MAIIAWVVRFCTTTVSSSKNADRDTHTQRESIDTMGIDDQAMFQYKTTMSRRHTPCLLSLLCWLDMDINRTKMC